MILAMENAGQLIEDEELRHQIKSCGIGTSATRAEILKKLCTSNIWHSIRKLQVITPTLLWRDDLMGKLLHQTASEPGTDCKLGKRTELCGRGQYYRRTEYMDKLNIFCAPSHQTGGGQQYPAISETVL